MMKINVVLTFSHIHTQNEYLNICSHLSKNVSSEINGQKVKIKFGLHLRRTDILKSV